MKEVFSKQLKTGRYDRETMRVTWKCSLAALMISLVLGLLVIIVSLVLKMITGTLPAINLITSILLI
jgi:hypothetical protein